MDRIEDFSRSLPRSTFSDLGLELKKARTGSGRTVVVLDDDPTGCQTMHRIPVFFRWNMDLIREELEKGTGLFFLMTNSRSLTEQDAVDMYREIGELLKAASEVTGRSLSIISRSDSTLRGHYPAEPAALHFLYDEVPVHCIIPAFFQGGRFTIADTHYVLTGEELIPASDTPFAKDKVFGFSHADLKLWVEEKTSGTIQAADVFSFGLEEMRTGGPEYVESKLMEQPAGGAVVINALEQNDLDIFALGAMMAETKGARLLFRTAASFLNSYGAIPPVDPLSGPELRSGLKTGGLFIAGSYVPKTTTQLENLIESGGISPVELIVPRLLTYAADDYIEDTVEKLSGMISEGRHVLLYTSRKLVAVDDPGENLAIGKKVSDALVKVCRGLQQTPSFIVAKGGITSHDIASRGLRMNRAMVAGPALPGVPVLVPDDRPDLKYIVFPGNVGEDDALVRLFEKLR
jgi:uncharacterized protein YgbK (DUF1537 family)